MHTTKVVEITSSITGRIWMDRALGANRAAQSIKDFYAAGCLYQWGRGNDGHASVVYKNTLDVTISSYPIAFSDVTSAQSSSDTPVNELFRANATDWRSPTDDNLWQGINGVNNPCPSGFRLPTKDEVIAETKVYDLKFFLILV
jgi:hypothetical protein